MLLKLKIIISKRIPIRYKALIRKLIPPKKIPKSPQISSKKLRLAKLYPSRIDMLKSLFPGGNILEIGVASGKLAREILKFKGITSYSAVDVDFSWFQVESDNIVIKRYEGLTQKVLPEIKETFSIIYLDASHDYKSVMNDLDSMSHLLKSGTIIFFNDFAICDRHGGRYGVHAAASTFINKNDVDVLGLALEPNGLYDLAVKIV